MDSFSASLGCKSYSKLDVFDTFDVVVLGGGPAGSATAISLANSCQKNNQSLKIIQVCGPEETGVATCQDQEDHETR